jgi:hypothetical protein
MSPPSGPIAKVARCALLLFLAAAFGCSKPRSSTGEGAEAELAGESTVARFTIVHSPHVERDTILLDTLTGRTWTLVNVTDLTDEPAAWEPIKQINTTADMSALSVNHPPKTDNAAHVDAGGNDSGASTSPPKSSANIPAGQPSTPPNGEP